ncbi:MAG: hypothetical protein P8Y54_03925 [Xanthomonadales bacterium]
MNGDSRQTRRFGIFLLAAGLLHGALLLIPAVRQSVMQAVPAPVVAIRLQKQAPKPPVAEPVSAVEPPPDAAPEPPPPPRPEPVRAVRQPEPPPVSEAEAEPEPPVITAHRILSDLAEARRRDPLAAPETPTEPRALFQAPLGPGLDDVLNEPSLQLPFRDRRIYLVDAYAPGIGGSVDRFFDRVTVPFGFQTKNNTRIQCAWVLIVAGCAWGDASLFYAADKARKRPQDEG